jgi:hypothetical protein
MTEMTEITELSVTVTYNVSIGGLKASKKVREQLLEAYRNGHEINPSGSILYPEASDWISSAVKEADCLDWSAEITEIA